MYILGDTLELTQTRAWRLLTSSQYKIADTSSFASGPACIVGMMRNHYIFSANRGRLYRATIGEVEMTSSLVEKSSHDRILIKEETGSQPLTVLEAGSLIINGNDAVLCCIRDHNDPILICPWEESRYPNPLSGLLSFRIACTGFHGTRDIVNNWETVMDRYPVGTNLRIDTRNGVSVIADDHDLVLAKLESPFPKIFTVPERMEWH